MMRMSKCTEEQIARVGLCAALQKKDLSLACQVLVGGGPAHRRQRLRRAIIDAGPALELARRPLGPFVQLAAYLGIASDSKQLVAAAVS